MENTPSVMSLHLRYRLWIAELNSDINALRIFDDYIKELSEKKHEPAVNTGIEHFSKQFIAVRKEIDELRHEMHLLKMKLAAYSRQGKSFDNENYNAENHTLLEKRYALFRKNFDKIKKEFSAFEGQWLK